MGTASAPSAAQRRLRVRQLCLISGAALSIALLLTVVRGVLLTAAVFGGGAALTMLACFVNRAGRTGAAGALLLWTLAVLATLVMLIGEGPRSPVALALPGVLVCATMLVSRRHLWALLAYMVLSVGGMTALSLSGLHMFRDVPWDAAQFAYFVVALGSCAILTNLLADDLRGVVGRLRREVRRTRDSRERLAYLAHHDPLTGLANRLLGQKVLEAALKGARIAGAQVGLMFLDLDNFKAVNDTMGHFAGDELLRQVGLRIDGLIRDSDAVVRQGGDEFLVILRAMADREQMAQVAGRVLDAFDTPFAVQGVTFPVSCSIGIAVYPEDGDGFDELLKKADVAVRHVKESGRRMYRFFDDRMHTGLIENFDLTLELKQAIGRDELCLHYQPLMDLASGRLVGAEALLRWLHPTRGTIPPGVFIPLAERSGLIVELTEWVIDEACRQLSAWLAGGMPPITVAVNTSGVQFKRGNIDAVVRDALARHRTPPERLELEVTESSLIHDADALAELLQRLKRLGISLAIDDFGTGYSNLSYLQRFEVRKLKIDQSFVRRLVSSRPDRAIIRAIVQMAHGLGMKTTAEGIEDEATRLALIELGCDEGQGFLLGRPQPASELEALVRAASARDAVVELAEHQPSPGRAPIEHSRPPLLPRPAMS